MNRPWPIVAAGWISMFVIARVASAIARGTSGTRAPCSADETRWASSAWTPGQLSRISSDETPRAAGSRSRAAATSQRISRTTRDSVPTRRLKVDSRATEASVPVRREERRRDVALARVGQHRDDPLAARLGPLRQLERGRHGRAARHPGQDPLPRGEQVRVLDRLLVGAGEHLVDDVQVEDLGNEARADALDAVRARAPAGQHGGRRRLDADDERVRVAILERLAHAGDRAAGADARDE